MIPINVQVGRYREKDGNVLYEFSHDELAICDSIARARNAASINAGITPTVFRPERDNSAENNILAMRSEWAVARLLGTIPDVKIYTGGDGHRQDVQVDEIGIEVKYSRTRPAPHFMLASDQIEDFGADYGVLCRPRVGVDDIMRDPYLVILGGIARLDFVRVHEVKDFGNGDRLAVRCDQLSPFMELLDVVDAVEWLKRLS